MKKFEFMCCLGGLSLIIAGLCCGQNYSFAEDCYVSSILNCPANVTTSSCPTSDRCVGVGGPQIECGEYSSDGTFNKFIYHKEVFTYSYSHHIKTSNGSGYVSLKDAESKQCVFKGDCNCDMKADPEDENQMPFCGSNSGSKAANSGDSYDYQQVDTSGGTCVG